MLQTILQTVQDVLLIIVPSLVLSGLCYAKGNAALTAGMERVNPKLRLKMSGLAARKARKWLTILWFGTGLIALIYIFIGLKDGRSAITIGTALASDCLVPVLVSFILQKNIKTFLTKDRKAMKQEIKDEAAEKREERKDRLDNALNTFKTLDESQSMQHKRLKADKKLERKMAIEDRKLDRADKRFDMEMAHNERKFDRKMDMKDKRAELVGNVTQAAIAEHSADKQFERNMRYLDAKEKVVRDMEAIDVKEGRLSENEAQRRHLGRQLGVIEMQQAHAVKDPEAFKEACARAGVDTEGKDLGEVASTIIKFAPTAYLERLPEDMPDDEKAMRIMQGAV